MKSVWRSGRKSRCVCVPLSHPLPASPPEPSAILELLLPRYVVTLVYRALLESSASEHASRRRAMKTATENAHDLLSDLMRVANLARQSEITTEIMDIVGGAEALRQKAQKAEKVAAGV